MSRQVVDKKRLTRIVGYRRKEMPSQRKTFALFSKPDRDSFTPFATPNLVGRAILGSAESRRKEKAAMGHLRNGNKRTAAKALENAANCEMEYRKRRNATLKHAAILFEHAADLRCEGALSLFSQKNNIGVQEELRCAEELYAKAINCLDQAPEHLQITSFRLNMKAGDCSVLLGEYAVARGFYEIATSRHAVTGDRDELIKSYVGLAEQLIKHKPLPAQIAMCYSEAATLVSKGKPVLESELREKASEWYVKISPPDYLSASQEAFTAADILHETARAFTLYDIAGKLALMSVAMQTHKKERRVIDPKNAFKMAKRNNQSIKCELSAWEKVGNAWSASDGNSQSRNLIGALQQFANARRGEQNPLFYAELLKAEAQVCRAIAQKSGKPHYLRNAVEIIGLAGGGLKKRGASE